MKIIQHMAYIGLGLFLSSAAIAKTEQITLKKDVGLGEEAIIFTAAQGTVILNYYALPDKVAKQIKPYKKGQCLEIQSRNGFFKDTGDGSYIQSIQPCKKNTSSLSMPKVNR